MIIAIDGTLASGKGTIATRIAQHYRLPHLDTGLLYRAVAASVLQAQVDPADVEKLAQLAGQADPGRWTLATLREDATGAMASRVSVVPQVRAALFARQRAFATQPGGAVLDGRDIGTVIAPFADVKLFVDADPAERARRRHLELLRHDPAVRFEDVLAMLMERDHRDRTRVEAPLQPAPDSVLLDTTHLDAEDSVREARAIIDARRRAD